MPNSKLSISLEREKKFAKKTCKKICQKKPKKNCQKKIGGDAGN